MNGTDRGRAAPLRPRVQSMHTGVQLVTRALARRYKGHILLS